MSVYMFCAPILSMSEYVNRQTFENVTSIYHYTFYVFRGTVRLFYPYEYHINLCSESCLSGQPSCMAKTLTLAITHKLFNQIFISAMLIGTIDFCHFIPLSLILTLAG